MRTFEIEVEDDRGASYRLGTVSVQAETLNAALALAHARVARGEALPVRWGPWIASHRAPVLTVTGRGRCAA